MWPQSRSPGSALGARGRPQHASGPRAAAHSAGKELAAHMTINNLEQFQVARGAQVAREVPAASCWRRLQKPLTVPAAASALVCRRSLEMPVGARWQMINTCAKLRWQSSLASQPADWVARQPAPLNIHLRLVALFSLQRAMSAQRNLHCIPPGGSKVTSGDSKTQTLRQRAHRRHRHPFAQNPLSAPASAPAIGRGAPLSASGDLNRSAPPLTSSRRRRRRGLRARPMFGAARSNLGPPD